MCALLGGAPPAFAFEACTAAAVFAADPGNCPNSAVQPCNILSTITLPAAAAVCIFDFGTRAVSIGSASAGGGKFSLGSKIITIKAGSLTIYPNGSIEGIGSLTTAPNDTGGMVTIQTTGAVTTLSGGGLQGKIDVSGRTSGGAVTINAGDTVSIGATINAGHTPNAVLAAGGTVRIDAKKDIVVSKEITAEGGADAGTGGEIDLNAGEQLEVTGVLTINGADGGLANLSAGRATTLGVAGMTTSGVSGNGRADFGSGGSLNVTAAQEVEINGTVSLNGSGTPAVGGGCGGMLCVESTFGGISVVGKVFAEGAVPDAAGGEVALLARADIDFGAAAVVSTKGVGTDGCGGGVCVESDADVTLASGGLIDSSGGAGGGEVDLLAGRNIVIGGEVDVTGRNFGSIGGTLSIEAGNEGSGNLTVTNLLDVGGGSCDPTLGCGEGGTGDVVACNLTISSPDGELRGRGSAGGALTLTARKQMTISGKVNASRTAADHMEGAVTFRHVTGSPPSVSGQVSPPATSQAQPPCDHAGQNACLVPCPTCGDGIIQFPETCDTQGPPVNCDGCSSLCRLEGSCTDARVCTADSCDPAVGCTNLPIPGCVEPTRTPTDTPSAAPTHTATPTLSRTPTLTPTPAPCPGDCNLDDAVSEAEIGRVIGIINLCSGSAAGCPAVPGESQQCFAADVNGDGAVSAAELTRILSNQTQFAMGCPP